MQRAFELFTSRFERKLREMMAGGDSNIPSIGIRAKNGDLHRSDVVIAMVVEWGRFCSENKISPSFRLEFSTKDYSLSFMLNHQKLKFDILEMHDENFKFSKDLLINYCDKFDKTLDALNGAIDKFCEINNSSGKKVDDVEFKKVLQVLCSTIIGVATLATLIILTLSVPGIPAIVVGSLAAVCLLSAFGTGEGLANLSTTQDAFLKDIDKNVENLKSSLSEQMNLVTECSQLSTVVQRVFSKHTEHVVGK